MSVRLRAPDGGFRIEVSSPETQWTESDVGPRPAISRCGASPSHRRAARSVLQLVVAARMLARDGIMAETTLPERVISVRVRTNYVRSDCALRPGMAALAGGAVASGRGCARCAGACSKASEPRVRDQERSRQHGPRRPRAARRCRCLSPTRSRSDRDRRPDGCAAPAPSPPSAASAC